MWGIPSRMGAVVSICIISAHKKKGHGAHFTCPITKLKSHLAGIIYVDDTDLVHFRMDEDQGKEESLYFLQEAITNWGKLLLASGGALKPIKCFYHLISFEWKADGSWVYENNEESEEFQAVVPLADGSVGEIQHLGIDTPIKTLGSMTCPSGCSKGYSIHTDKRDGLEGHDQDGEAEQEKCVVHAR